LGDEQRNRKGSVLWTLLQTIQNTSRKLHCIFIQKPTEKAELFTDRYKRSRGSSPVTAFHTFDTAETTFALYPIEYDLHNNQNGRLPHAGTLVPRIFFWLPCNVADLAVSKDAFV
jgi:hypothetical protein